MCCCGAGVGSSLIVRMNTEDVLKKLGMDDIQGQPYERRRPRARRGRSLHPRR
ncbi:MAG: hypothetical protein LKE37_03160 [Atopobiaceae bacterium]|nr:hypothetical protein [Atopobiaceae bacterium]